MIQFKNKRLATASVNTTARAIDKLVCSTLLEIPIENVLSQRKLCRADCI